MEPDELIERWLYSAESVMPLHYEAAQLFTQRHYWIGVPALVLSTAVGTTVFAALRKDASLPIEWVYLTGIASMLAAILTALQTFLGYNQRAEKHKSAGAAYAALIREIHQQKAFPSSGNKELQAFVANIRVRFDALSKESPSLPPQIWKRAEAKRNANVSSL